MTIVNLGSKKVAVIKPSKHQDGRVMDKLNEEKTVLSRTKFKTMKGHQAQITLALPPELLERANAMADQLSISRAAFMKLAITRAVEAESPQSN